MLTLLYQQHNLEIFWDTADKWLNATWSGRLAEEDVKRGCDQLLRLMVARNTDSLLDDHAQVEAEWPGAMEWRGKDWIPRMRAAGLRNCAFVFTKAPASPGGAEASTPPAGTTAGANVFWKMGDAVHWLRAQRRRNTITQRIVLPPELRGR